MRTKEQIMMIGKIHEMQMNIPTTVELKQSPMNLTIISLLSPKPHVTSYFFHIILELIEYFNKYVIASNKQSPILY
jgi:hypothetical protein